MKTTHADVAELADAQVSEACDGDIVEVQVLSSAPVFHVTRASLINRLAFLLSNFGTPALRQRIKGVVTHFAPGALRWEFSCKSVMRSIEGGFK